MRKRTKSHPERSLHRRARRYAASCTAGHNKRNKDDRDPHEATCGRTLLFSNHRRAFIPPNRHQRSHIGRPGIDATEGRFAPLAPSRCTSQRARAIAQPRPRLKRRQRRWVGHPAPPSAEPAHTPPWMLAGTWLAVPAKSGSDTACTVGSDPAERLSVARAAQVPPSPLLGSSAQVAPFEQRSRESGHPRAMVRPARRAQRAWDTGDVEASARLVLMGCGDI